MKNYSCCEICGSNTFEKLSEHRYDKHSVEGASEYLAKRIKVMFDVWFSGEHEVLLEVLLCKGCGFVCYTPRPEVVDVDAKYGAFASLGRDYGKNEDKVIERLRGERLLKPLKKYLRSGRQKILDYGGGDGRLMAPFAEAGHDCCLIDYNESPRSYVKKVGDTIFDLDVEEEYDVIVASHVIEHIAEPRRTLQELKKHLKSSGKLLVEVPMEIWRESPLNDDPLTHINFFVPGSLKRLLQESGYHVFKCSLESYLHSSGKLYPGVLAIAGPGGKGQVCKASGYTQCRNYLSPHLLTRIARNFAFRESWVRRFKKRILA